MQLAATDVLDISKESAATKKLYGLDNPVTAGYGLRCHLMARRLIEAGVRFVHHRTFIYPGTPKGQPCKYPCADNPFCFKNMHGDFRQDHHLHQPQNTAFLKDLNSGGLQGECYSEY